MTPTPITLKVISTVRTELEKEIESLVVKSSEGSLGVRPGHATMIIDLVPCTVQCVGTEGEFSFEITGGFLKVENNQVLILADSIVFND